MRFQFSTPFRKETAACHGDADFLMALNDGVLLYFTFYCVIAYTIPITTTKYQLALQRNRLKQTSRFINLKQVLLIRSQFKDAEKSLAGGIERAIRQAYQKYYNHRSLSSCLRSMRIMTSSRRYYLMREMSLQQSGNNTAYTCMPFLCTQDMDSQAGFCLKTFEQQLVGVYLSGPRSFPFFITIFLQALFEAAT